MQSYERLEIEYAKYVGTKFGVVTNTGTAALHLALEALGVGKGDEVIVPEYTMIASAWAVSMTGAKPVFVDCTDDLLIDTDKIERKITLRTKAIMPVHVYGRVCNMDKIMELANKYKLRVVEDCCEAQGAMWKGKTVGSFDVGCFSFFLNKIIPAEEGGIITTNDERLVVKAKDMRSMSFGTEHNYLHGKRGFNYRMTNAQAELALFSLSMVNGIQQARYRVEGWYDKYINPKYKMPKRNVVWVYDIRHPKKDKLVKFLNDKGYKARHGFKPMSLQPMYPKKRARNLNAYKLSREICYLPVSPLMTEEMVKELCTLVDSIK